VDQGVVSTTGAHNARLLLIFFGAVLGFLALSFVFGSTSASADDGADSPDTLGSALGGIVSSVTDPVAETVTVVTAAVAPVTEPVAATVAEVPVAAPVLDALQATAQAATASGITTPVAAALDGTITKILGSTPLGPVLGTTPVGSILHPVVVFIDGAVAEAGALVVPGAAGFDATLALAAPAASAVAASIATADVVSGAASGLLDLARLATDPGTTGSVGTAGGGAPLLAAIAGAGFLALLVLRRPQLVSRDLPGSPVYDTDSSPD
jgi:hypothetical protein